LNTLKEQLEAQKIGNKTGLTPSDPEVEFGYLWGSPSSIGNRKDVSVRQTFDFPTVYVHRGKLSDLQNNSAEYQYASGRMELLLSAKKLCVELVYYNALREVYARQLGNAGQIAAAYEQMEQAGDANRLEYNKAALNLANMENEVKRIDIERERILSELARLNGGNPVAFDVTDYGQLILPDNFETWFAEAEAEIPALQYLRSQVEVNKRKIQLSRATGLPKLSVGYMGEFVSGQEFQGVTFGISIPLWENKNRIKQAKAETRVSERMVEDAKVQYYNRLRNLFGQILQLQDGARRYNDVFEKNDNDELLFKAYNRGEISLLNYLLELEYFFVAYDKLLQVQRDLEFAMAELNAFRL
jgi:cobalt-zinc-cadmium efflux system outer membrane protein